MARVANSSAAARRTSAKRCICAARLTASDSTVASTGFIKYWYAPYSMAATAVSSVGLPVRKIDRHVEISPADGAQQGEAVHGRHPDVAHDDVEGARFERLERLLAVRRP